MRYSAGYTTDAYFSSSSIMQQMRLVCSHAIIVEPLPPKVSSTTACEDVLTELTGVSYDDLEEGSGADG